MKHLPLILEKSLIQSPNVLLAHVHDNKKSIQSLLMAQLSMGMILWTSLVLLSPSPLKTLGVITVLLSLKFLTFLFLSKNQKIYLKDSFIRNCMLFLSSFNLFPSISAGLCYLLSSDDESSHGELLAFQKAQNWSPCVNATPWKDLESYRQNPTAFIKEYFTDSTSLVRFISERAKEKGIYLYGFLKTLPLKKKISVDNLKWIVVGIQYRTPRQLMGVLKHPRFSEDALNTIFQKYEEEDLKKLLTKYYDPYQWLSVLYRALNESLVLEKEDSVLRLYNKYLKIKKIHHPQKYQRLHNLEEDGYKFVFLTSHQDYQDFAETMSNCVASYYHKDCDVVAIYKDQQPYACMEIRENKIHQLKGLKNRNLTDAESHAILYLVRNAKRKA